MQSIGPQTNFKLENNFSTKLSILSLQPQNFEVGLQLDE